ncbi:15-hydroxyprostaglandin dehydrogenase [Trichonephila clavipes]|nr:15-hydroxyprostaglandin dehydrogenase [Trichonephila clavipes]
MATGSVCGANVPEKTSSDAVTDESSESDGEPSSTKSFQRRISTSKAIKTGDVFSINPLVAARMTHLPYVCGPAGKEAEQPTLNHVQSDMMASAVLADPTRALQGTNRGSELAMEESENDVGSLEQLLLYADEHYLAGKLPLRETI